MAARALTPRQAVEEHLASLNAAVRCIAHGTLVTTIERRYAVGHFYALVLNARKPLRLRTTASMLLDLGQHIRIVRDQVTFEPKHRVEVFKYFYAFSTGDNQDVLTFHWTPEERDRGRKTFPHVHVGQALLAHGSAAILRGFHKRHVPTGLVSVESIIRFAIEELGVPPLRDDWIAVLDQGRPATERFQPVER